MRSRQHVGRVVIGGTVGVATDELRLVRAPSSDPVTDVEDDGSVLEVGQVRKAVLDLEVVQVAADRRAGRLIDREVAVLDGPAADLRGCFGSRKSTTIIPREPSSVR